MQGIQEQDFFSLRSQLHVQHPANPLFLPGLCFLSSLEDFDPSVETPNLLLSCNCLWKYTKPKLDCQHLENLRAVREKVGQDVLGLSGMGMWCSRRRGGIRQGSSSLLCSGTALQWCWGSDAPWKTLAFLCESGARSGE